MCHLVCHLGMYVCALWYNTPVHWAASETTTDTVRLLFAAAGNHVPAAGPHTGTPQITRLNSGRQVLRHSSCPPPPALCVWLFQPEMQSGNLLLLLTLRQTTPPPFSFPMKNGIKMEMSSTPVHWLYMGSHIER